MALGSHLIKYNATDADTLPEVDEAREQRRHRIGSRLGIDHQYDGNVQHLCDLCRGALVTIIAVEKAHHALHDADIGLRPIVDEDIPDMLWRRHKGVEIDAGPAAYRLVELRIDIVGTALEGLHLPALGREQRHQASGDGCLARAARWCRYHECRLHRCKGKHYFISVQGFFRDFLPDLFGGIMEMYYLCSRNGNLCG